LTQSLKTGAAWQTELQWLPHCALHVELQSAVALEVHWAAQSEPHPVKQSLLAPLLHVVSIAVPSSAWHMAFRSIIAHWNGH
jgi:hypothetical protein